MTDAGWALKKVGYIATDTAGKHEIARLLKAEHARSVRIVSTIRTRLVKHNISGCHNARIEVCNDILTALQRGRGGKG